MEIGPATTGSVDTNAARQPLHLAKPHAPLSSISLNLTRGTIFQGSPQRHKGQHGRPHPPHSPEAPSLLPQVRPSHPSGQVAGNFINFLPLYLLNPIHRHCHKEGTNTYQAFIIIGILMTVLITALGRWCHLHLADKEPGFGSFGQIQTAGKGPGRVQTSSPRPLLLPGALKCESIHFPDEILQ